jgi:hypothetical protein
MRREDESVNEGNKRKDENPNKRATTRPKYSIVQYRMYYDSTKVAPDDGLADGRTEFLRLLQAVFPFFAFPFVRMTDTEDRKAQGERRILLAVVNPNNNKYNDDETSDVRHIAKKEAQYKRRKYLKQRKTPG